MDNNLTRLYEANMLLNSKILDNLKYGNSALEAFRIEGSFLVCDNRRVNISQINLENIVNNYGKENILDANDLFDYIIVCAKKDEILGQDQMQNFEIISPERFFSILSKDTELSDVERTQITYFEEYANSLVKFSEQLPPIKKNVYERYVQGMQELMARENLTTSQAEVIGKYKAMKELNEKKAYTLTRTQNKNAFNNGFANAAIVSALMVATGVIVACCMMIFQYMK